jgi:hypothetical protein
MSRATSDDAIFILSRPADPTRADADWARSEGLACLEYAVQREFALAMVD